MNAYHVRYFYLATGMEGRADQRDHGVVHAASAREAVDAVINRSYADLSAGDQAFVRGCLIVAPVGGAQ